jgi:hypothetical protein
VASRTMVMRAVTARTLVGAFDWDSLLTNEDGHYESGVYIAFWEASVGESCRSWGWRDRKRSPQPNDDP